MAGAHFAFLVAFIGFMMVAVPVGGDGGLCIYMTRCTDIFRLAAERIGNDPVAFCRAREEQLKCFQSKVFQCASEQRDFANSQIRNVQAESQAACDASSVVASFILVTCGTGLVLLYKHLL